MIASLPGIGLGHARAVLLDAVGPENVLRWLPFDLEVTELRARVLNTALRPYTPPHTVADLLLDHALAREALRLVLRELAHRLPADPALASQATDSLGLPQADLLIASGGIFSSMPRPVQAALTMLDVVQPATVTQLALDRTGALPLLGTLQAHEQDPVAAALERDGLINLGLCLAPTGPGREGDIALRVEVERTGGVASTVEIPFGSIEVIPFDSHNRAELKFWPGNDFDIGLGRGVGAAPGSNVEGGLIGLIVDARGRPLVLPPAREKRQARLIEWFQVTGAYPELPISAQRQHPAFGEGRR
jgi:hypothetical protein